VLLELLEAAWAHWLVQLERDLDDAVDADADARLAERGDQMAAAMAASLAAQPVLCDLLSARASVLEHNLSSSGGRSVQACGYRRRRRTGCVAGSATA
jgi:hypothetical protein